MVGYFSAIYHVSYYCVFIWQGASAEPECDASDPGGEGEPLKEDQEPRGQPGGQLFNLISLPALGIPAVKPSFPY